MSRRSAQRARAGRLPARELAALGVAVLVALAVPSAAFVTRWYSNGLYPPIDRSVRLFTDVLPFSLGDVLFLFAAVALLGTLMRAAQRRRLGRAALGIAATVAVVFVWFMFSWGYNYHRIPIEQMVVVHSERNSDAVLALGNRTIRMLNADVAAAHREMERRSDVPELVQPSFIPVIRRLRNVAGEPPPPIKPALFNGFMQATATYGFTNPWTHEITLVSSLFPFERPASYAHEWGHISGFADESEANYLAAVSCLRSHDPLVRYSGWLLVWFNLPSELSVTQHVDRRVYADIEAVKARYKHEVKPAVARVSNAVYNRYLKANNVKAGMQSYHLFVRLLAGGEFDGAGLPVLR